MLQRLVRAGRVIACSALLAACAQIHNEPINQPLTSGLPMSADLNREVDTYYDDTVVALSFSGGGTRAAAFSYGVLSAMDETTLPGRSDLADRSGRLRHRRLGWIDSCRLLRTEEAQGAGRFQAAFPPAQCGGKSENGSEPPQHRQGLAGRHQRPDGVSALARRQSLRPRDVQIFAHPAAAVYLDQRLRCLQPHAVRIWPGSVRRVVQRSRDLSDLAGGGRFGGRPGYLCAGRH